MRRVFCVVGGDARQRAAGEYLRRRGYCVVGPEELCRADYILLPLPLDADQAGIAKLLEIARPGALAFGGRVGAEAQAAADAAGIVLLDYFRREELAQLNAIPTAEGCLGLLLQNRRRTLWGSPILVAGYGRVGQAVAGRLHALGALVTVTARHPGPLAMARANGCTELPLRELESAVNAFDTAVNTIPAPVFTASVLRHFPPGALLVDLASRPGGTDFPAAVQAGVRAIHALSLPARCAPETAGELVGHTVLTMLRERSGEQ